MIRAKLGQKDKPSETVLFTPLNKALSSQDLPGKEDSREDEGDA